MATGQADALQPRVKKDWISKPGSPSGKQRGCRCESETEKKSSTAVVLQGGDPQILPSSCHRAWSLRQPVLLAQLVGSFGKFRDALVPALAEKGASRFAGPSYVPVAGQPPIAGVARTPSAPSLELLSTSAPIGGLL